MAFEHIIFEVQDGIVTITFNRPKALNALNRALLAELNQALGEIENDDSARVLILTGAGDKAFVAGADITELAECNTLQAKRFAKLGQQTISRLQALDIPVIAAVNGFALGGGSEIALACDFIYAAESATFGLPEITLGLIPGFGGTQRLPRLLGANRAKELIFTGQMVPAAEALAMGWVNTVCPIDDLMDATRKTAAAMAAKGRVALRAAKQAINNGLNTDLTTGLNLELDAFAICMASADAKEGTAAFLEKRTADFTGGWEG
jgi:enoyl-CoA hydratase